MHHASEQLFLPLLFACTVLIVTQLLTDVDVRVLGSLIEKEQTTPEYYPLSLNALVTACNQSTNRDPVVKFDESIVTQSIEALRQQGLIRATKGIDARVTKYAHRVDSVMNLNVRELAVLCVLMLRGAQTSGELRTRTARIETFEGVGEVEAVLDQLILREFAVRLPRQPGQKETRYMHRLTGDEQIAVDTSEKMAVPMSEENDRLLVLEEAVDALKKELIELRSEFGAFRSQLE